MPKSKDGGLVPVPTAPALVLFFRLSAYLFETKPSSRQRKELSYPIGMAHLNG